MEGNEGSFSFLCVIAGHVVIWGGGCLRTAESICSHLLSVENKIFRDPPEDGFGDSPCVSISPDPNSTRNGKRGISL